MKAKCPFLDSLNRYDVSHTLKNDSFSLMRDIIPEDDDDDTRVYFKDKRGNSCASYTENEITVSFIPLRELIE